MTANRPFYCSFIFFQISMYQGAVFSGDWMLFQLICQTLMCISFLQITIAPVVSISILCTMPGRITPLIPGKMFLAVKHYCIDHCMGIMSGTWMNYHSFGFIDDQHIFIFIQNIQWNISWKNVRTTPAPEVPASLYRKAVLYNLPLSLFFIDCHISFFQ